MFLSWQVKVFSLERVWCGGVIMLEMCVLWLAFIGYIWFNVCSEWLQVVGGLVLCGGSMWLYGSVSEGFFIYRIKQYITCWAKCWLINHNCCIKLVSQIISRNLLYAGIWLFIFHEIKIITHLQAPMKKFWNFKCSLSTIKTGDPGLICEK